MKLGLEPLQAHLVVFWFALLSTITPPVCGAVFIASGMIEENWIKVALTAMALGLGLYLIPLGMITWPALIALPSDPFGAVVAALAIGLGLAALSYAVIARLGAARRLLLLLIGIVTIFGPVFMPTG